MLTTLCGIKWDSCTAWCYMSLKCTQGQNGPPWWNKDERERKEQGGRLFSICYSLASSDNLFTLYKIQALVTEEGWASSTLSSLFKLFFSTERCLSALILGGTRQNNNNKYQIAICLSVSSFRNSLGKGISLNAQRRIFYLRKQTACISLGCLQRGTQNSGHNYAIKSLPPNDGCGHHLDYFTITTTNTPMQYKHTEVTQCIQIEAIQE